MCGCCLPALAALSLRWRQVSRLACPHTRCRAIVTAAFVEGFVWAVAFWIKPFVAVPALLCWLLSARLAWTANRWRLALDGAAVLAGGLAAGAAGCAWLVGTGAWPAFAEIMFVWNREYLAYDITEGHWWLSWMAFVYRFVPWVLVHVVAVPMALSQVYRAATGHLEGRARPLLAGLYLGWLLQSVCLQHLFDYVQTPAILLGLIVVASWCVARENRGHSGLSWPSWWCACSCVFPRCVSAACLSGTIACGRGARPNCAIA